jgi:ubiquinone/menaquinone biosynthesis C-methylase UbiE
LAAGGKKMRKIENDLEIFDGVVEIKGKRIVDVGCGAGELVRMLTEKGAQVTGIDIPDMIGKALAAEAVGDEAYLNGQGESMPIDDNSTDIAVFLASLHHIPELKMNQALREAHRILKKGGIAVIVEPVGEKGSYFELVHLVEDEREIQRLARETVEKSPGLGFEIKKEDAIYMERSFEDFKGLIEKFVDDKDAAEGYIGSARNVTERMSAEAGIGFDDYRFKSICSLHVLRKV